MILHSLWFQHQPLLEEKRVENLKGDEMCRIENEIRFQMHGIKH